MCVFFCFFLRAALARNNSPPPPPYHTHTPPFYTSFSNKDGEYSQFHFTHPYKPIMGGESASCVTDRGYYRPTNASEGHMNSDDDGCVVSAWASAAENAWDSGNFVWTGHDYKGEPSPLNWPDINSHFGVLDLAGFEKDTASYYRAQWLPSGPTYLQLVPKNWNSPVPPGQKVTLRAFTGAAAVEAFVNGVSLGWQAVPPYGIARWEGVAFAPGNITAVAFDAANNTVATSVVATTGPAARLVVEQVAVGPAAYAADGQDVGIFTVSVVDDSGSVVPDARHLLTYVISSGPGTIYVRWVFVVCCCCCCCLLLLLFARRGGGGRGGVGWGGVAVCRCCFSPQTPLSRFFCTCAGRRPRFFSGAG